MSNFVFLPKCANLMGPSQKKLEQNSVIQSMSYHPVDEKHDEDEGEDEGDEEDAVTEETKTL